MLPRSRRLSRVAFDLVRASTFLVGNSIASLRFQCRHGSAPGRFSVVVPRAVDSRAVVRNTWRRRIYSIIQQTKGLEGIDGILYVGKSKQTSYTNLTRAVDELLAQALKHCGRGHP